jgi:hypothetical protein
MKPVGVDSVKHFEDLYERYGKDVAYTPVNVIKVYGKEYRPADLMVAMLKKQVPIACECGVVCNFGRSPKKASRGGMSKYYVNCGHWRGKKYEAKSTEGCSFVAMVQMPEEFVWEYSPMNDGSDEEPEPELDPEPVPKRVRTSAASRSRCARCGLEQAGGVLVEEERLAGLTCEQRAEIEDVLGHMLEKYFQK